MSNASPSACKILIVEDELLVAADIQESLSKAAYQIVGIAEDYPQAVSLAESHRPDLALVDIALRGKRDGIAVATSLRERWKIPVVFLTANADEETVRKARSVGPNGFLTKPFQDRALHAMVRIALDQHDLSRELFASKQWLTAVLGSLTDAVISIDPKGFVRSLNPTAEELTGWMSAQIAGKFVEHVLRLTKFDGSRLDGYPATESLTTGLPISKQRLLLTVNKRPSVPVEVFAAPIIEDGKLLGSIMVLVDIASRLRVEHEQEVERDRLGGEAKSATLALGQTRAELRALSDSLITAQEDERRRVARELHDDLGQQAALLGWTAQTISEQISGSDEKGCAAVDRLNSQISRLCNDLRTLSHRLHPSVIRDLGLAKALENLVEEEREHGRDIHFTQDQRKASIPIERATVLYRIAQEALRNAAKHAPGARVIVTLSGSESEVKLTIRDNGMGFSPLEVRRKGGLGLMSMQERARLAGGFLSLTTNPGQGTTVSVQINLAEGMSGASAR